jgi:hypothetical protein
MLATYSYTDNSGKKQTTSSFSTADANKKSGTTVSGTTKSSSSTSKSTPSTAPTTSSGGFSGGSSNKLNTAGLSGYALDYANAYNQAISGGANMTAGQGAAEAAANQSTYGSNKAPLSSSTYGSLIPSVGNASSSILPSSSTDDMTWEQKLAYYGTNKDAATTEIQRAKDVYNTKMAAGDTEGAAAAHTWANQIRDSLGLVAGKDYNATTGAGLMGVGQTAAAITPVQAVQTQTVQPDIMAKYIEAINQPYEITPAPVYKQPDYSDLIPSAQQGVSATANAADTYFLPTKSYNDRVAQMKANADEQAYRTYTGNLNAWQNQNQLSQSNRQNQLNSLMSMLPYTNMTAAQQATVDQQKAADVLARLTKEGQLKQDEIANEINRRKLELEEMRTNYEVGKPYYNPYSGGGGGGSGGSGGGLTAYQQATMANNEAKNEQAIRDQAVSLAVKDPDYYSQTPEGQNTIIGRYIERLKELNY